MAYHYEASRSKSLNTPHSVGLLWTSDQPDSETSACQHTTLTRDRRLLSRRDSNPQFQQTSGGRPILQTARPMRSAYKNIELCKFTSYVELFKADISIVRSAKNIVHFLLCISPASNCSWPTFRNPVSVPSSKAGCTSHCTPSLWRWNCYRVPKRRPTTIWRRGNTQKKIYDIQITAKIWNQECKKSCRS